MNRFDKYLKVVNWAMNRYLDEDGGIIMQRGLILSTYWKIERLAAVRYLGV